MTRLNSADLRERIVSAGVAYLPAEQIFYSHFPYKVELSPKFKGLGGVNGKRGCQIDVSDPVKARIKLDEFVDKMNKLFANVESRREIKDFVEQLPREEYKIRVGGENNLFYFRDAKYVVMMVERYSDLINSVTGPINAEHETAIKETNVVMRDRLYFGRYRYLLELKYSQEVADKIAQPLKSYLESLDAGTWRSHKLDSCIRYYEYDFNRRSTGPAAPNTVRTGTRLTRKQVIIAAPYVNLSPPPSGKIQIYLADGNDYVYIKMMAAEFVISNHELLLFGELK